MTPLEYYALARDFGWSPDDEDTPQQFCASEGLTRADTSATTIELWRDEFNSWKATEAMTPPCEYEAEIDRLQAICKDKTDLLRDAYAANERLQAEIEGLRAQMLARHFAEGYHFG